jgi:hypothetical protein
LPEPSDPVRKRLEALRDLAQADAKKAHCQVKSSGFWNYTLLGGIVLGGLVATVSGSIASQNPDASWLAYVAAFAGAGVTACSAAVVKFKAVEKLRFANEQRARFRNVVMKAENGMAVGRGMELVDELTDQLTETYRREPPD